MPERPPLRVTHINGSKASRPAANRGTVGRFRLSRGHVSGDYDIEFVASFEIQERVRGSPRLV